MATEPQFMKLLVSAIKSSYCVMQDILSIDPSKVNILDGLVTSLQPRNSRAPTKLQSLLCSHWHLKVVNVHR